MKNNFKLFECFGCYSNLDRCKREKLPRKKKKQLKTTLSHFGKYINYCMFSEINLCNLALSYKDHKKLFSKYIMFKKYKPELIKLLTHANEYIDQDIVMVNGVLSWTWEDDNGLYSYDGTMPFAYSEAAAGKTWAYSELLNLLKSILNKDYGEDYNLPVEVVSDKTLLKYLRRELPLVKEIEYEET